MEELKVLQNIIKKEEKELSTVNKILQVDFDDEVIYMIKLFFKQQ